MPRKIIKKELYLKAPQGESVYAGGQYYTSEKGLTIIESVRHEKKNTTAIGNAYYSPMIYERISKDNGLHWYIVDEYCKPPDKIEGVHEFSKEYFLDLKNNILIRLWLECEFNVAKNHEESFSDAGCVSRTLLMYYQTSRDEGRSWDRKKQIICQGGEYDHIHWGPGLRHGENGGMSSGTSIIQLKDGTILLPATMNLWDGKRYQSCLLRGTWNTVQAVYEWDFSDYISLDLNQSTQGACEIAPALMPDGTMFVSIRACGDRENKTFPSMKYWVVSKDGGKTFSKPEILKYEDGKTVWSPSSYHRIIRSTVNKQYYWIGNILDAPTYGAYPRYPLCIAEFDPHNYCLIRKTVTLIDTKPSDFPDEWRRYTNFGLYEDRQTKEIVLTLPEQPKISKKDFTSDCYIYRINV
jgi:hypothetical protein